MGTLELLERSQELSVLRDRMAEVTERSTGRLVLVRGEAGIGKTVLLRQFCDDTPRSVRVLWAACDPLFTPRPLGPLLDIARETAGDLRTRVEAGGQPHDVAAALLRELESARPTVLVLEDVHWADEATLDVMRLVSRRVESVPTLLVASYRDDELDRSHPLRSVLGQLPRGGTAAHLDLSGLSRAAVAELARGAAVDAGELYERTAGNPFFVTEVLAAGQDSVPTTVRDAVLARATPLSPQARAMLDAVAVVPQFAEMWLLDRLTQSPPGTLEECLRSGMLRAEAATVGFRHELARLAVEESLAPDLRLALHRLALAALMEPPIGVMNVARLAHHAVAAADPQAVLRFAPAAAEQAAAAGAHREAAVLYREASRFAGSSSVDLRAALLAGYASESLHCDQNGQSIEAGAAALECYRQLGDPLKEGELLSLLSEALWCVGRVEESTQAGSDAIAALERCPSGRELAVAYAQRAGNRMTDSDYEGAMMWGGRAVELAERLGETDPLVRALIYMGTSKLLVGEQDGMTMLERGMELAREARLDDRVGNAYVNLASVASSTRAHALVDGRFEEGLEFCTDRGLDQCRRYLLAYRARIELDQGRYDDAAESATFVLSESSPSVLMRILPQVVLATVRARRGDPDVKALIEDALRLAESDGELQAIAPVAAARAEIAWLEGEREAVEAVTESTLALAIERESSWEIGELACWRSRAGIQAPPPAGAAEPYALQIAGDWARAADVWNALGCPYEAALALIDGDDQAMRSGLAELHRLGARAVARIVERRLRERGARGLPRGPRAQTRANLAGLTERELEILPLLAEGLRTAQIAQRLIVSQRTVDHHISSILRKLGVHTRGEAAAQAARLGLSDHG